MKRASFILAALLAAVLILTGCVPGIQPAETPSALSFTEAETAPAATDTQRPETVPFTEEPSSTGTALTEAPPTEAPLTEAPTEEGLSVTEDGSYTSKDEVALYLHLFGHLPDNYLTKNEAEALGWVSSKGNLWDVAPGAAIGGNRYGNYEGGLPDKSGRKWYECDVNYEGGYRGAERILYSNDGLVYYTGDHYKTFTLLYGED